MSKVNTARKIIRHIIWPCGMPLDGVSKLFEPIDLRSVFRRIVMVIKDAKAAEFLAILYQHELSICCSGTAMLKARNPHNETKLPSSCLFNLESIKLCHQTLEHEVVHKHVPRSLCGYIWSVSLFHALNALASGRVLVKQPIQKGKAL